MSKKESATGADRREKDRSAEASPEHARPEHARPKDDRTKGDRPEKAGPEQDRLRFIKHNGHAIFVIDFSHCSSHEILLLLDQVRADVARHAPGSMLTLADFTGAEIDKSVATRLKEVLVLDRPFVKKSAWVGAETLPHVYYENIKSFSQRDFPIFKTREEAMDWLIAE